MKRILYPFVVALALLCAFGAIAANIATGTQGPWYAYVGAGTGSPLPTPYASFDLCKAGTQAMKIGSYVCRSQGSVVVAAAPPVLVFTRIVNEGEAFTVTAGSTVRFGQDTRWVQKAISGASACTIAVFGSDPAVGTFKQCEVANGSLVVPVVTPPPPAPATVSTWITFATEGDTRVAASGQVRYGYGINWLVKTVTSGIVDCNNYFPNEPGDGKAPVADPMPGFTKHCQKLVSAPNVVQTGMMPVVNQALIQPAAKGASTFRIGGPGGDKGNLNQDTGAMREPCEFSHFGFNDPVVFPGQTGASHLHVFFGNTAADAFLTPANILSTGDSTCKGGTANRTGYWAPALIDLRNGAPLAPDEQLFYYKCGYLGVVCANIQPFPAGLRMIAGNSANTTEVVGDGSVIRIWCEGGDGTIRGRIPSCNRGEKLSFTVIFPQCWDGVNLDSPNHKSHMAYANNGCPATHPVPLPEITEIFHYIVEDSGTDTYFKLSSDNYVGVGGFSMHADWMNGWDAATQKRWVTNCINPMTDCHANLLGDGYWLD